jgi:hypothetical protein
MSPIEKMFAYRFITRYVMGTEWLPEADALNILGTRLRIVYSPKIFGKSGKFYYPDFTFKITGLYPNVVHDNLKMLIELDGHIWHERTPEKVEADKIRERDLIDNGYTLYRFSGREIHKDIDSVIDSCVQNYIKRINNG